MKTCQFKHWLLRYTILMSAFVVNIVGCSGRSNTFTESPTAQTQQEVRDVSLTGIAPPLREPIKWQGSSNGLLFAEASGDTYACGPLYHPGHDSNVAWTYGEGDYGTPIYAIADGKVVDTREPGVPESKRWGAVLLEHQYQGKTFESQYGHAKLMLNVVKGQIVRKGQKIATVARVGTEASHLHFEIRTALHPCNQEHVTEQHCFLDARLRPVHYFTCSTLNQWGNVTTWYRNPWQFIVSLAMEIEREKIGGLLLAADVPTKPAFPPSGIKVPKAVQNTVSNPKNVSTDDAALQWCRNADPSTDFTNCLMKTYSALAGYAVYPIMNGALKPYWIEGLFGERWHELLTSSDANTRKTCGMPITNSYQNCTQKQKASQSDLCNFERQDFQSCYLTALGTNPQTLMVHPYPNGYGPGAYANNWTQAQQTCCAYADDDAGYLFAEAYERSGGAPRLGWPTLPTDSSTAFVTTIGRYHIQYFSGYEWTPAVILYDPENKTLTSKGVWYGDTIQAVVLHSGFLEWYVAHDGLKHEGIPLGDEYIDPQLQMSRLDLESGNCLVWKWYKPGNGQALCGTIDGASCINFDGHRDMCPTTGWIQSTPGDLTISPQPNNTNNSDNGGGADDVCPDTDNDSSEATACGGTDCDDGDPTVCASCKETCDGKDNNCDGQTDENNPGGNTYCDTGLKGACKEGSTACENGSLVCHPNHVPVPELCNKADDNCDGFTDETFDFLNDPSHCGACTIKCLPVQTCKAAKCQSTLEICNNLDDDGDGIVDDYETSCGYDACAGGTQTCHAGAWGPCYREGIQIPFTGYAATENVAGRCSDDVDNDCDSKVDCADPDCQGIAGCSTTDAGSSGGSSGSTDAGFGSDAGGNTGFGGTSGSGGSSGTAGSGGSQDAGGCGHTVHYLFPGFGGDWKFQADTNAVWQINVQGTLDLNVPCVKDGWYRANGQFPFPDPNQWMCNEWPSENFTLPYGPLQAWVDGVPVTVSPWHDPTIPGDVGCNLRFCVGGNCP